MTTPPQEADGGSSEYPREFERLWRGLMTARATLGAVLVLLQVGIYLLTASSAAVPLAICVAYAVATLTLRLLDHPQQFGHTLDAIWLRTVGLDVLTFSVLQVIQGGSVNYTALLALPVLMVSVLGAPLQAIASAAGVTLLLFGYAGWAFFQSGGDASAYLLQAALTGAGCFAVSFIASQIASRLASVELRAQRSQLDARVQQQVNQLVIETLTDGILVVAPTGSIRLTNPAAAALLDTQRSDLVDLAAQASWRDLMTLVDDSFRTQAPQQTGVEIRTNARPARRLLARTQLTSSQSDDSQGLCVMFLQDQREFEARIRAEKLTGMGRMSAAVAHEIRNPLAAIAQANDLMAEDLSDPAHLKLAQMIRQNANRLEGIIRDILHLVQVPGTHESEQWIELRSALQRIVRDWSAQCQCSDVPWLESGTAACHVWFDPEHLRRVLTNLLDNALRHASRRVASIQISAQPTTPPSAPNAIRLSVWSDGAALDPSVEQHLFEPFFSSESRSSGLGLYICRELCESHGALIGYGRNDRQVQGQRMAGNEFFVIFKPGVHLQPPPVNTFKILTS